MNFLEENNILESSLIYENFPSSNYYPQHPEINIIPKECFFIDTKNDNDNYKYKEPLNIFNEKITKDTKDFEDLIDEKNLLFVDKEKNISKNHLLHENFRTFFKTQKEKLNEDKNKAKLCGQKRVKNDENYEKQHNKFSDDTLIRKCKYLVLKNMFEFLNKQIKILYKGKLGKFIFKKELKIINQNQISNSNTDFNKNFMSKKLCDIFSDDISNKYTNFPKSHNRNLINNLMNENDENKKIYFQKLFNLKFIQCLKHFSGEEHNDLLKGLKCFKDIKNEIVINDNKEDNVEYYDILEFYLKNYEKIINNKRPRNPKK